MKKHPFNTFLLSICLVGILGVATHALLMVHLACCHESSAPCEHNNHDKPKTPGHDHANCLFCQMFMGVDGKYVSAEIGICPLTEIDVLYSVVFTSHSLIQHALTCAVPHGPPIA